MEEPTLSEKLAALPYEAKVRIFFRLLNTAGRLRNAKRVNQPLPAFKHFMAQSKSKRRYRT